MAVSRVITPTESEEKLFKILTDTLRYRGIKSTLRCAGGWVRDKLLGLESDDIDIAIDDMLGKEFADHVNAYLTSHSLEAQKVHTSI
jgi:tRNA nucleotidyltransferase/poly(A) polymerase